MSVSEATTMMVSSRQSAVNDSPPYTKHTEDYVKKSVAMDSPSSSPPTSSTNSGSSGLPPTWNYQPIHIPSHAAAKVIKGEIHNVLSVMRLHSYISHSRFHEEFVDLHPLAQRLQELHLQLAAAGEDDDSNDLQTYIMPFCEAVTGRDISAPVTGAALSAIHKFMLYGFVSGPQAPALLSLIAESLTQCRFEETEEMPKRSGRGSTTSTNPTSTAASLARATLSAASTAIFSQQDEEQVVLKLLDLSALTVRISLQHGCVLKANLLVGLVQTCLHVSHRAKRASPLLRSAAADALSQMVLIVFAGSSHPTKDIVKVRHVLLQQLAQLLHKNPGTTNTALTLLNIALETTATDWNDKEMDVLQNDVCKYLLSTSTSHDLRILTLTLRVIFNLFDSMRNQLKVQLEVFLTSVHLRILETASEEEKEVVLESLVEFCQEPALMHDIYLNYDCDISCTNLYEAIVAMLGKVALPTGWTADSGNGGSPSKPKSTSPTTGAPSAPQSAPASFEVGGGLNGLDSGSKHNRSKDSLPSLASHLERGKPAATTPATVNVAPSPLTHLNRLALEGLLAVLESLVSRQQHQQQQPSPPSSNENHHQQSNGASKRVSQAELMVRKQKKDSLSKIATAFNGNPMGQMWLDLAVAEGQLDAIKSAEGVAQLLYTAPDLDRVELGLYLSKGPEKDFPFQAAVREKFVKLFDFTGHTFAAALRKFLSKFRLPGEAQCIDRLMEAFSTELYRQQGETSFFKNSDAVYVLSFSTIMLNTDLHNTSIKTESRMTLTQFIRNNRGINGGEDLPEDFLTELYEQIKVKPIQVKREIAEVMLKHENVDFRTAWEGILTKTAEVESPFFTSAQDARRSSTSAGAHDKEMFTVLCKYLLPCLSGVFLRSWDDALVVKASKGMRHMAKLAAYYDIDWVINDILQALLPMGRDYVMGCVALDFAPGNDNASVASASRTVTSVDTGVDDDDQTTLSELPIPYGLLCSGDDKSEVELYGSAAHRGILALDCSFILLRKYGSRVSIAWPSFIECLCALRDARALPAGLADLDDFADSSGNVLPLSTFAKTSMRRLDEYYRAKADPDAHKQKGWFRSFFRKSGTDKEAEAFEVEDDYVSQNRGELSSYAKALLGIAVSADVENVIQMGSTKFPAAEQTIRALLEAVGKYPYGEDPVLEQHAVFSLELAARALLTNRERAPDLFPIFLTEFERILGNIDEKQLLAPFVLERIVVTVLRACIHLYDLPELRPNLRASLHLLMMVLPKEFIRKIADRMACGIAIILRSSFQYFETANEWAFMGDTLDMLAHFGSARVFVFDGIASTVEYALPADDSDEHDGSENGDRPELTTEACTALSRILIRFVLGFYQNDESLCVPAALCLEKVYLQKTELLRKEEAELKDDTNDEPLMSMASVPDKELWQNFAVAVYSVCRSLDPEISRHAVESFQRIIIATPVEQIPDEKWIAVLYLIVNKQPPLVAAESRGGTFSLLAQLLCRVVPELSHRAENREDLTDLISATAALAEENLRQGRKGNNSPLFQSTLQGVTYLSNHMMTDEWKGEPEFSSWASETLLSELEKVGAAGASLKNQAAVTKKGDMPDIEATKTETNIGS